ncbi:hypothetical protein AMTR_s00008p00120310 [Amborella trichopoda]|uniref:Uncharacterized protein n=1 Tax=Amborella trichopoda TaxID=13333 RepID=W1NIH8_AMBTC|nr:hypothetical protein AMTR_s00008p00120310 [Amborella trichopoda]
MSGQAQPGQPIMPVAQTRTVPIMRLGVDTGTCGLDPLIGRPDPGWRYGSTVGPDQWGMGLIALNTICVRVKVVPSGSSLGLGLGSPSRFKSA